MSRACSIFSIFSPILYINAFSKISLSFNEIQGNSFSNEAEFSGQNKIFIERYAVVDVDL